MNLFRLNKEFTVVCNYKNTRNGFKHTASITRNGYSVHETKCCYLNRTWESYTYQSVLHKAIDGYFDEKTARRYKKKLDNPKTKKEDSSMMKSACMVASLGNLFCNTEEDKNKWKKRFVGKVEGIDIPEDFDDLSEEEKKRRLDGVIEIGLGKED